MEFPRKDARTTRLKLLPRRVVVESTIVPTAEAIAFISPIAPKSKDTKDGKLQIMATWLVLPI